MPDTPPLTLLTVFRDEFSPSSVSLTFRKIWGQEVDYQYHHTAASTSKQKSDVQTVNQAPNLENGPFPQPLPDSQIPKPPGEVARLSRGGYSLAKVLMWDEEFYSEVQVHLYTFPCIHSLPHMEQKFIRSQASIHLRTDRLISMQQPSQVDVVCENVGIRCYLSCQFLDCPPRSSKSLI